MSNQSRKSRGMETQKLVAEALRDMFPYAESAGSGRPGRDILGAVGLAIEVKARRGLDVPAWLRQAVKEADKTGDLPLLIWRPDGMGPQTVDLWPMTIPFGIGRDLLKEAGYGA